MESRKYIGLTFPILRVLLAPVLWALLLCAPIQLLAATSEVEILCEAAFESFDPKTPQTIKDLKRRFLNIESVSDAEISQFLSLIRQDPTEPRLVLHVENSVLKELKDEAFQDGETAVAVTSLYKQIFFELLVGDRALMSQVRGMYGDYKSARILFATDHPELKTRLQNIFTATNRVFAQVIELHPQLKAKYQSRHGIAESPLHWHQAGFGEAPSVEADAGATAARAARDDHDPKLPPRIHDFNEPGVQDYLRGRFERAELARRRVIDELTKLDGGRNILTAANPVGIRVLSKRLLRAVMAARTLRSTEFVPYVQRRIRLETGLHIPAHLLASVRPKNDFTIQDYVQAMDAFSPSPYQKSEVVDMGLRHEAEEFVIIDGVGQSSENFFELSVRLAGIAQTTNKLADVDLVNVAREARLGQDKASAVFEKRGEAVDSILKSPGLQVHKEFSKDGTPVHSGDDTVLGLAQKSQDTEKIRITEEFRTRLAPGKNRLVVMSARYHDRVTGKPMHNVEPEERGKFEDAAFAFDKDLGLELLEIREKHGLTVHDIESTVRLYDLTPYTDGAGIRIFVNGPPRPGFLNAVIEASERVNQRDRHNLKLREVIAPPNRKPNQLPEISSRHEAAFTCFASADAEGLNLTNHWAAADFAFASVHACAS